MLKININEYYFEALFHRILIWELYFDAERDYKLLTYTLPRSALPHCEKYYKRKIFLVV
jgi:hypothetical protein